MSTLRRPGTVDRAGVEAGAAGPILLATLGVPFDPVASSVAVDAAVENGRALVVVNAVELPPLVMSVRMGYDQLDTPEDEDAFRAPAELARALGVAVERVRVRSMRPLEGLLELARERRPALLVFGPDRASLGRRRYRRAARAVRDEAMCLVWLAE